jgi:predicted RNase H-like nuclease (RuvC/YqgF family)
MAPSSRRDWPSTLERAQYTAAQGRFDSADSILARFAAQYAGSREALETAYWRAVFKLDPLNRTESLAPAMALLDSYLGDTRARDHAIEATSLRRIATQLDALNTRATATVATAPRETREPTSSVRPPAEQRPATDQSASDAEIKRLKDELAKANAELERIRRRLMRPPPS